MNYKFTSREIILLKTLGIFIFFILIYLLETTIISKLNESREALNNKVIEFNINKKQLSQLKQYQNNKKTISSNSIFTEYLKNKKYVYEYKQNVFEVKITNKNNLFELLNFIDINSLNIQILKMELKAEDKLIVSINFDS
tara:strand:+ start:14430 stop:14849 length:420 start_codon:yes stop_codon:yes gene_type:complete